jgi:triosephosphate isomerase (TIM)
MKKLIIANWTLNPSTLRDAQKLAGAMDPKPKNKVVLCPPSIYLSNIKYPILGAQDCFWEDRGHFTGQVSPLQLKNIKIKYCIVGHSEKRETGENDVQINLKLKALAKNNIIPILCVGYGTTAEEDDMAVVDVLKHQLEAGLVGVDMRKVVVAYEPVWAISSGDPYLTKKHPTPEHAERISLFIKTRFNIKTVIYGGSANAFNAKSYLDQQNVDGLLVGGDSLIPKHFNQIINI